MPAGQQVLQSILLQSFTYRDRVHPWNPTGRTLSALFGIYGTWVSPQPGRVVFGSTLASRMCAYLLPNIKIHRRTPVCAGIPGLRFVGERKWGYLLHHLPTDTPVEVHDERDRRTRRVDLMREVHVHRDDDGNSHGAVWRRDELSDAEHGWSAAWRPAPHTNLYSALFAALPLFDYFSESITADHACLAPAPHVEAPAVMTWCGTLTPLAVVTYLNELGIGDGVRRLDLKPHTEDFAVLSAADGTAVELHRRSACTGCNTSRFDHMLMDAAM
jgi:hypothetical protein